MDVLYPCTFCSETFTLRKYFLTHMENAHQSNVPLAINNFSRDPFICSMCSKQFMSKNLLRKHIILGHNKARKIRSNKVSYDLNNYLLLKDLLPNNYAYQILDFEDKLFGHFKAKFQIIDIDKETFLDWLNNLCLKSKVNYKTINLNSNNYLKNVYQKLYICKNINYWNNKTNCILENPTNCKSSLSVIIKPLNKKLGSQTKAIILMKHCHYHPMNYFTSLKLYQTVRIVYNELIHLLKSGHSAAIALHLYKIKTIQNQGKNKYLNFIDSGVKPDVEFVYDMYYMHIGKSKFASPFIKQVESLMTSVNYFNYMHSCNTAVDFVKNNIVVAIQTPFMKTINTDVVLVCSTSFNISKTWFMYSYNDKNILTVVGVIIATDDKESMLKSGLELWKKLGGNIKTVIVEFIHMVTFQSVFPNISIYVSKFHFLLGVWKWLFSFPKKNNLNNALNCFVKLKKFLYSNNCITDNLNTNSTILFLTKNYPNFKLFMKTVYKSDILFHTAFTVNPCSSIFERKLIYYETKSLSILQMFHFITDKIDLFYENMSTDRSYNQQTIINDFKNTVKDEKNFTLSYIDQKYSSYVVEESDNNNKFFVDMDIGLCSCSINNVCAPCIHQFFLNKHLNDNPRNCVINTNMLNVSNNHEKDVEPSTDKEEFEEIVNEFQFINNKIKEQFLTDPDYFKFGIKSFVSSLKNNLVSNKSLYLACHSLNNVKQLNIN